MKAKHYLFATLLSVILTGCYDDDKLWDAVNQQATRIEALESWQKETNSNIQALQTLVSTQDFITQVTPVTLSGDTVGYTIDFKNSKSISIYHGRKGATGEKGEPGIAGTVPTISATQEADGNWYWTLNGTLMKDASGNPARANGQPGNDAPPPLLKTGKELTSQGTSGYWISDAIYLSVDNGTSWTKVSGDDGQDGTDGTDGSSGSNGDSMFAGVDTSAKEEKGYVAFELSNGSEFKVPIYRALTLRFSYKSSPSEKLDLNTNIEIAKDNNILSYHIENNGINIDNIRVSATIAAGENWKPKVDRQEKTISFDSPSAGIVSLLIIATNNAGHSCRYILNLKKNFNGSGEKDDPFTISTPSELEYFAKQVNAGNSYAEKVFKLENDMDLKKREWTPIGRNDQESFQGTFDGGNYAIKGLKVTSWGDYGGLFGYTQNATLKNLTLCSPDVQSYRLSGSLNCGSLVGYAKDTNIENCYVTNGTCSTINYVGGLVGFAEKIKMINCHVKEMTITADNFEAGGLIGRIEGVGNNITNCSATECQIKAKGGYCGGLIGVIGFSSQATLDLTACYTTGDITSSGKNVGALIGVVDEDNNSLVNMKGCYSTCIIEGVPDKSVKLEGGDDAGNTNYEACYYITDKRNETVGGVIYKGKIDNDMINAMNAACGRRYYDEQGALIPNP